MIDLLDNFINETEAIYIVTNNYKQDIKIKITFENEYYKYFYNCDIDYYKLSQKYNFNEIIKKYNLIFNYTKNKQSFSDETSSFCLKKKDNIKLEIKYNVELIIKKVLDEKISDNYYLYFDNYSYYENVNQLNYIITMHELSLINNKTD
jgi:hypothetical protein